MAKMTLDDLRKLRNETKTAIDMRDTANKDAQIIVGMGSAGIAAGARQTLQKILQCAQEQQLTDITVSQTGNLGLESWEPVVQVLIGRQAPVFYGKVTPRVAERIMREHVQGCRVVSDYVIPA